MDVLEVAARATGTGPVCDACLGRLVADRSFGLSNAERGSALRTSLALRDDEDYEPVETADCWVCEGAAPSSTNGPSGPPRRLRTWSSPPTTSAPVPRR